MQGRNEVKDAQRLEIKTILCFGRRAHGQGPDEEERERRPSWSLDKRLDDSRVDTRSREFRSPA